MVKKKPCCNPEQFVFAAHGTFFGKSTFSSTDLFLDSLFLDYIFNSLYTLFDGYKYFVKFSFQGDSKLEKSLRDP